MLKTERKLGAHVSVAGGFEKAFKRIQYIGGNCMQIFSGSPRGWQNSSMPINSEVIKFKRLKADSNTNPIYYHASYLINLADNGRIGKLSKQTLIAELKKADALGVKGSIVHLGSFKNQDGKIRNQSYKTLIKNIKDILKKTPKNTLFIIENAGTRKIGQTIDEISKIMKDIRSNRVRVCLDTCHLHAAGYDISSEKKLKKFIIDFSKNIGVKKLEVWHANDSRDAFGSLRDRHENIGQGQINLKIFQTLLNNSKTRIIPFIIETPGFDQKGPDKRNLDILKKLIKN